MTSTLRRHLAAFAALALVLAACGGSEADPEVATDFPATTVALPADADEALEQAEELAENAEQMADDMVENLEEQQAAQGGGSATLTVGDQTWEFDSVLCAFGEDEIGQEGAELVVSSLQDGLQFYVSIDSFGHMVSLDDVSDFENPSVSLSTFGSDDFIVVDGKNVSGEAGFMDSNSDSMDTVDGSFQVTCP